MMVCGAQFVGRFAHYQKIEYPITVIKMLGTKLSPILAELEDALWEFEAQELGQPHFTDEGFRAAMKIFMCAMMDKMWDKQQRCEMKQKDREKQAVWLGGELHKLVKHVTGIDAKTLYD